MLCHFLGNTGCHGVVAPCSALAPCSAWAHTQCVLWLKVLCELIHQISLFSVPVCPSLTALSQNSDRDHRMQQIQAKPTPWPVETEDHKVFHFENESQYVWFPLWSISGLSVPIPANMLLLGSVMEGRGEWGCRVGSAVSIRRNVGAGWQGRDPSRNYS